MVQAVTNGLGYRMFRSTSKSSLGISVTDFYITSTSYAGTEVHKAMINSSDHPLFIKII
jgi:hypothetical protein